MNTTEPHTVNQGGHRCKDTGTHEGVGGVARTVWRCVDCKISGTSSVFTTGTDGCPMRPESLDYLSVCPGDVRCAGHMNTASPEYRMWRDSPNMPKEDVPRFTCRSEQLGMRAVRQWKMHADKIGINITLWFHREYAPHVGATGGKVADFTIPSGEYHLVVTQHGKLRTHAGMSALGCDACADLMAKGEGRLMTGWRKEWEVRAAEILRPHLGHTAVLQGCHEKEITEHRLKPEIITIAFGGFVVECKTCDISLSQQWSF